MKEAHKFIGVFLHDTYSRTFEVTFVPEYLIDEDPIKNAAAFNVSYNNGVVNLPPDIKASIKKCVEDRIEAELCDLIDRKIVMGVAKGIGFQTGEGHLASGIVYWNT